jgi:hypothetical protein
MKFRTEHQELLLENKSIKNRNVNYDIDADLVHEKEKRNEPKGESHQLQLFL